MSVEAGGQPRCRERVKQATGAVADLRRDLDDDARDRAHARART